MRWVELLDAGDGLEGGRRSSWEDITRFTRVVLRAVAWQALLRCE